jgi:hypothetical protein
VDRASRYDAIIATLVGILALLISAYTAWTQRQQVRAQVYPYLQLTHGHTDTEVHIDLANKGSGPAFVRNISFVLDGKPIHDWLELVQRTAGPDGRLGERGFSYSGMGHAVLSAGEHERVLEYTCKRLPAPPGATRLEQAGIAPADAQCARLRELILKADIRICYCSTLDECMEWSDGPEREPVTEPKRRCPARGDDSFN